MISAFAKAIQGQSSSEDENGCAEDDYDLMIRRILKIKTLDVLDGGKKGGWRMSLK
jgi:hypothetical protein